MRRLPTRRALAAPALVAFVLTVFAFAASPATAQATPKERILDSVEATLAAGSMKIDGSAAIPGIYDTPLTFTGAITADGRDGELMLDFGSFLPSVDSMRELVVDGTYFIELAPLTKAAFMDVSDLPRNARTKTWVRTEPEDVGQAGVSATGSDPATSLATLRAISDVQEVGVEDVRGVPATHFTGEVDPEQVLKKAPKRERKQLKEALRQLGDEPFPVELWLDESNRLLRFDMEVEAPTVASPIEISTEYHDFGTPVDVQAPPKREVISFADYRAALQEALRG